MSKIIKELPELVEQNVISKEVATKIEHYYLDKQSESPNRLVSVFGVLGALLIGLGIILILAHNWDSFNRTIKTIFAFLPLVIGQLFAGYTIAKKKSKAWRESTGTFLFCAIGSSISLVSQIYNIPGNLGDFILTWTLLALPVIYLLRSNVLAILCLTSVTYYAVEVGYAYYDNEQTPWLYLLVLAAMIPHYLKLLKAQAEANITSIFNWLYPLSLIIVIGSFVKSNEELGFLIYLLLFSLYYGIGKIPFFENQKLRRNGYVIFGSLGIIIMLLMMSFDDFWFMQDFTFNTQETYIAIVLFIVNTIILLRSFQMKYNSSFNLFQYVFIIFTFIYFFGFHVSIIGPILVNLIILILGVTTIKIGSDKFHFGILNYGLLIITALVICRFFDTNMSFVIRGLLFVIVGVGFFLANYLMLKKRKSISKS
ncbi:DUF2157 domain-containing protein [Psychroserpens sp.]|uniref:DUF2157 domain-containing protein n=1 Tax=Psychroserpens sp. TaxID=2020870 RepID=UPI001B235462|nr:DUF2157 domain-containing protein [Psychroserpens sp.]MBO6608000.1 DUF2157 domain-containing protein [Psychroserpens sp.]MBO6631870.1 DUF2157 domain-containing protein [Psychroserpens sp.]MBO6654873.1 DUF2157 domain-containing protein [Psychroserpens sp.]MBO6683053.1 DUF2157 domain-containing protein [Psychroserpens sp.]MBO6751358.1 DUF2157 domain-containing protein [Psychroserpens sp.]